MNRIAINKCLDCGKPISPKAKRCRECFHESTRGRIPHNKGKRTAFVVCVDCGKKSYHKGKTSNYYKGKNKWLRCSACYKKWIKQGNNTIKKGNIPWNKGTKINKEKYPQWGHLKKHTEETKKKLSLSRVGKGKGIKNGNWKGGVTELRDLVRQLPEYNKWRKNIFERNNYTCQICGKRGCYLEADHYPIMFAELLQEAVTKYGKDIEKIRYYKPLFEAEGRTLCKKDHKKTYVGNQYEGGIYL